jgi:transposase
MAQRTTRSCSQTLVAWVILGRMERGELTDAQWARLRPLLPLQQARTGRPVKDRRLVLWIDRTEAPWRGLPARYGPWQTVATRCYRWVRAGVPDASLAAFQRLANAQGRLNWSLHHVDGSSIRAHQHAAGARWQRAQAARLLWL